MPASNTLKTASVLAFERKLDTSDALFSAGAWDNRSNSDAWPSVEIREKSVRGTISNRLKANTSDPGRLDAAIQKPNLQTVDVATLPPEADTLRVRFTLRVLGGVGKPAACNSKAYQEKLWSVVEHYIKAQGFSTLAKRYASNLANGRFLWRNRIGAESVEVCVEHLVGGQALKGVVFNALSFSVRRFDPVPEVHSRDLESLAQWIEQGLAGEHHLLLRVTGFARLGFGQEVFPSQELILDKDSSGKSKTLYHVAGIAGVHSQKIGNALRTIDTWYPGHVPEELGPIAVEPYGSVTSLGRACRQPQDNMDFYTLLDGWVLRDKSPPKEQQHYVMATLIRGGVFGESDKD